MTIGDRIKKRRMELGMSQETLAKKIGYSSRSSINKIELDIQQLRQSKIKDIATALNTTTSLLIADGVPLEVVSRMLGHDGSRITKQIYIHITQELKNRDREILSQAQVL